MKLPKGWKYRNLGHFIEELEAGVSVNGENEPARDDEPGVLKVSAVSNGRFLPDKNKRIIQQDIPRAKVKPRRGAIIITRSNTALLVADSAYVPQDVENCFLSDKHWQTIFNRVAPCSSQWLAAVLQTKRTRTQLIRLATGTSGSMKNISKEAFLGLEVATPPLPEQRKIAKILTTWDEALTQLDALIEAQERRKKALMQQLLSGKRRIPGFKDKWKRVSLGSVLQPTTRPVTKPEGTFLAAGIRSHGKGVFLKPDFKPADIALEELFELRTGDLVVNITFAWEGAAAIVPPEADGALVSHRFPTFGFREGKAALAFFRHYIRTKRFVFDCGLASPGGAGRNRVLSKSAFLDIELMLPPVEEQEKIGAILDTADQQLTLLRTQRTALDQQKRGLMQRLLTGKFRVKP